MTDLDRRAAIAMGWRDMGDSVGRWRWRPRDDKGPGRTRPRLYSTDMKAAMGLVEELHDRGWSVTISIGSRTTLVEIRDLHGVSEKIAAKGRHKLPPTAITLAFLELYDNGKLGEKT